MCYSHLYKFVHPRKIVLCDSKHLKNTNETFKDTAVLNVISILLHYYIITLLYITLLYYYIITLSHYYILHYYVFTPAQTENKTYLKRVYFKFY